MTTMIDDCGVDANYEHAFGVASRSDVYGEHDGDCTAADSHVAMKMMASTASLLTALLSTCSFPKSLLFFSASCQSSNVVDDPANRKHRPTKSRPNTKIKFFSSLKFSPNMMHRKRTFRRKVRIFIFFGEIIFLTSCQPKVSTGWCHLVASCGRRK